jgi:hypothetical protein
VPDDPAFQTRVLMHVLELLETPGGPVIKYFPEDAPTGANPAGPPACPVNFTATGKHADLADRLVSTFKQEVSQMRNWYDLAVKKRGRTTSGTTGLGPEETAEFLAAFVRGDRGSNPVAAVSPATALRMAAEDLKAYYLEAVTAQPGQPTDSATLNDWFWSRTAAAGILNRIRLICLDIQDNEFQLLGKLLLIPRTQLHNFG